MRVLRSWVLVAAAAAIALVAGGAVAWQAGLIPEDVGGMASLAAGSAAYRTVTITVAQPTLGYVVEDDDYPRIQCGTKPDGSTYSQCQTTAIAGKPGFTLKAIPKATGYTVTWHGCGSPYATADAVLAGRYTCPANSLQSSSIKVDFVQAPAWAKPLTITPPVGGVLHVGQAGMASSGDSTALADYWTCPPACTVPGTKGLGLTVRAEPQLGYIWHSFFGACAGVTDPKTGKLVDTCTVQEGMASLGVGAQFDHVGTVTIAVNRPTNAVVYDPWDSGKIKCGTDPTGTTWNNCSAAYTRAPDRNAQTVSPQFARVTLRASASPGYAPEGIIPYGWSQACAPQGHTEVLLSKHLDYSECDTPVDLSKTASFQVGQASSLGTFPLIVNVTGPGEIKLGPWLSCVGPVSGTKSCSWRGTQTVPTALEVGRVAQGFQLRDWGSQLCDPDSTGNTNVCMLRAGTRGDASTRTVSAVFGP